MLLTGVYGVLQFCVASGGVDWGPGPGQEGRWPWGHCCSVPGGMGAQALGRRAAGRGGTCSLALWGDWGPGPGQEGHWPWGDLQLGPEGDWGPGPQPLPPACVLCHLYAR